jgi:glycosyltransferase involved in cell wall biosynthesis
VKIAHFSTSEHGGSSVLMLRLHRTLLSLEHRSAAYLRDAQECGDDYVFRRDFADSRLARFLERLSYSLENRMRKPGAPSYFSRLRHWHRTPSPVLDADIVHLHWVGRWLDLPSFVRSLKPTTPIVWTVHDMSALAGGCFTDFGCGQFEERCGLCPLLKFPFDRFAAKSELSRRMLALSDRPVAFVANSKSTLSLVQKAPIAAGKRQQVIHPGFDFRRLQHVPRKEARAALGIPETDFVLGFGAASLTYENKGIDRFYKVAELVRAEIPQTTAVIFGDGQPEVRVPTRHLGTLSDDARLALAYSAMDAHLVTSQMETFGQVSVEAQACGTPVFAFAVGGVPETLVDGDTGGLVDFGNSRGMADAILAANRAGRLEDMGASGARWVRGQFDSREITDQYLALYEELRSSSLRQ